MNDEADGVGDCVRDASEEDAARVDGNGDGVQGKGHCSGNTDFEWSGVHREAVNAVEFFEMSESECRVFHRNIKVHKFRS